MTHIHEALERHTGRARRALQYAVTTKSVVDSAKRPGFTAASWDPLKELVAADEFERIGNFKERMDWAEYVSFLTNWAPSADWDATFKRVTEAGGVVFLELEERSAVGEFASVVNSLSVYEFNADERIRHIDVYLQMELPSPELLKGYEDVQM